MAWLKKNFVFKLIMVLLLAVLGTEAYFWLDGRSKEKEAKDKYTQKMREHQSLVDMPVLPDQRNIDLTQDQVKIRMQELKAYEAPFLLRPDIKELFENHPETSTNAFFAIESFIEEYRKKIAEVTKMDEEDLEGENFGFSEYGKNGPAEELIPEVHKQLQIVKYILDALLEAEPESIVSISRPGEAEGGADEQLLLGMPPERPSRFTSAQAETSKADYKLDSKWSAEIPGLVDTLPFQVVFMGRTPTLRAFANQLARFEIPIIIRSIEVVPAGSNTSSQASSSAADRRASRRGSGGLSAQETPTEKDKQVDENIPLVPDNLAKFTVALEFLELLEFGN